MLPPQDRTLANGIFTSGSAVGALVAPLIITPLAYYYGWRVAFFLIGALGTVWLAIWWAATRHDGALEQYSRRWTRCNARCKHKRGLRWGKQLKMDVYPSRILDTQCWWRQRSIPAGIFVPIGFPNTCTTSVASASLAAGLVATPIFLAADIGNIGGGVIVKVLCGRGWSIRGARSVAVIVGAILILPAATAAQVPNSYVCILFLSMAAVGIMAISANYLACLQDISFASVGLVAGILGSFGNVVGATINPLIGRYVDSTGNYYLIFVLLGTFPMISLGSNAHLRRSHSEAGENHHEK